MNNNNRNYLFIYLRAIIIRIRTIMIIVMMVIIIIVTYKKYIIYKWESCTRAGILVFAREETREERIGTCIDDVHPFSVHRCYGPGRSCFPGCSQTLFVLLRVLEKACRALGSFTGLCFLSCGRCSPYSRPTLPWRCARLHSEAPFENESQRERTLQARVP